MLLSEYWKLGKSSKHSPLDTAMGLKPHSLSALLPWRFEQQGIEALKQQATPPLHVLQERQGNFSPFKSYTRNPECGMELRTWRMT